MVVDSCPCCNAESETAEHLFLHCVFANLVWQKILAWLKLDIPMLESLAAWFCLFRTRQNSKKQRKALTCLWVGVCWSIWLMRNDVIFSNGVCDVFQVLNLIQIRSWTWLKYSKCLSSLTFSD